MLIIAHTILLQELESCIRFHADYKEKMNIILKIPSISIKTLAPTITHRPALYVHPFLAGTKRISITLRERKESLPQYLLPIPSCNCGVPAILKARVLENEDVEYYYGCDRGQGQCGFWAPKARAK